MATFQVTEEDLTGLVRERQVTLLKRALPCPVLALIVGLTLFRIAPMVAVFALGAASAWTYSAMRELRAVRPAYLWQNAFLQEKITVTMEEEGLRLANSRGASFLRWDSGIRVHCPPDFFVIKEEIDELAVLPKKHLSEAELLVLNAQAVKQAP